MSGRKHKRRVDDKDCLSAEQVYEINFFARRCGLTRDEALKMMRDAGRLKGGAKPSYETGSK
ncbi:MAG: hypothetical protein E5W70_10790 [Mesorhizobium sp.]|uniref:hypothetical protein n=1 Tax=unclassified Mesorhizobium TaxID=325217 RepID=UPI0011FF5CD7|nr:hypothetical protein [Mesorhizobium sp.]TIT22842.1 MAG: hypothetical protein E5W70_10790 [Mesorhizobium sp.]